MASMRLRRCPFCGGSAKGHSQYKKAESAMKPWECTVFCVDCSATVTARGKSEYESFMSAVEKWNTRQDYRPGRGTRKGF